MRSLQVVRAFLLLVVALSAGTGAGARGFADRVVMRADREDGSRVALVISKDLIEATPEWDPQHGEPPLSIVQAHRLALDWARREYVRYDDVYVREMTLARWSSWNGGERWYYRFELVPTIGGNELFGPGNWVAVLMDSTVIAPEILR